MDIYPYPISSGEKGYFMKQKYPRYIHPRYIHLWIYQHSKQGVVGAGAEMASAPTTFWDLPLYITYLIAKFLFGVCPSNIYFPTTSLLPHDTLDKLI